MSKFRDHQRSRNNPQQRLILGIFIVIIGALALIDNMGLFDTRQFLSFWPTIFIILGVLKISQTRTTPGFIAGSMLLGVGVLLTLQNLNYIVIRWEQWWPVLIIGAGLSYMFKGINMKNRPAEHDYSKYNMNNEVNLTSNSSDSIEIVAIMSGSKSSNATPNFQGGEITAIMGSAELDLRSASIQNEAVLHIFAAMGSVEIFVPNDWVVVLSGTPILGGIEDHSVPPINSAKRLVISGVVVMGGIEIKN
jgi:predicted membrane protein